MPDILIRGLEPQTVARLKRRAKLRGRSLQSEAKLLLEQAAGVGGDEVRAMLDKWSARFRVARVRGARVRGASPTRSADLLREDRRR